jgi:hypothetical protein
MLAGPIRFQAAQAVLEAVRRKPSGKSRTGRLAPLRYNLCIVKN